MIVGGGYGARDGGRLSAWIHQSKAARAGWWTITWTPVDAGFLQEVFLVWQLPFAFATPNPKRFHVVHQAAAAATARLDATEAGADAGSQQPSFRAIVRFQVES